MEDVGDRGGSLIGKTSGPRVRRFFRGAAEDAAPGGGGDRDRWPTTPENAAGGAAPRAPGSGPSPDVPGPAIVRKRRGPPDPVDVAREALEALGDAPDKRVDYAGWLQHCKAKWRLQRATRKRRALEEEKALAAASGAIVGAMTPGRGMRTGPRLLGPGGLGAFVESRERTLQNAPWQLVQVERSAGGGPGAFTVWVLAGGSLHAVSVRATRRLAVAMRVADKEGDLGVGGKRRIAAALPRGGKADHVYEVKMDESDFKSGLEVVDLLADPNVIGVFERHVPLLEASIQRVGCVATLRRGASDGPGGVYDVDDLEMRTTAECGYLPLAPVAGAAHAAHGMLRHVTLYVAGTKDKGVYALHLPASGAAVLVVVQPGEGRGGAAGGDARRRRTRARSPPRRSNARQKPRCSRRTRPRGGGGNGNGADGDSAAAVPVKWTVEYVGTDDAAGAAVSRHLTSYLEDPKGPTICLVEAPPDAGRAPETDAHRDGVAGRLGVAIPALARLPVVVVPANAADSSSMPALGVAAQRCEARRRAIASRRGMARRTRRHLSLRARPRGKPRVGLVPARRRHLSSRARCATARSAPVDPGPGGAPGPRRRRGRRAARGVMDATTRLRHRRAPRCPTPGAYRCGVRRAQGAPPRRVRHRQRAPAQRPRAAARCSGYDVGANAGKNRGRRRASRCVATAATRAAAAFRSCCASLVNDWLVDATERHGTRTRDALLGHAAPVAALRDVQRLARARRCGTSSSSACGRRSSRLLSRRGQEARRRRSLLADAQPGHRSRTGKTTSRLREPRSWTALRASLAPSRALLLAASSSRAVKQWHALLFRGPFDYGGLLASALPGAAAVERGTTRRGPDDVELDPGAVERRATPRAPRTRWTCTGTSRRFLPESLREHFEVHRRRVHLPPLEARARRRRRGRTPAESARRREIRPLRLDDEGDDALDEEPPPEMMQQREYHHGDLDHEREDGLPATTRREAAAAEEERRAAWLGAQVEGYFSQRVLRLAGEIQKHLGPGASARASPQDAFPTPPGAHLPKDLRGSPALAFIKTLCAALSLDTTVEGPVALLRKNALKLLRVPEYAPQAEFREPCVTFVLRDAVCGYCGDCRDLDLCRDRRLVDEGSWDCVGCDAPYDPQWIEGALVAHVNERMRCSALQDLRCTRDRKIKRDHLGSRCVCGGLYACTESATGAADDLPRDARHRDASRV